MSSATEASQQANRSGMDPKRLVVIFYLVAGVVLALFFANLLGALFAKFAWNDPELLEGLGWTRSTIVGVVLAAALAIGTYVHPRTHALSLDVASELMKVTWPTWSETRVATIAVVIASVIASIILFGIDTIAYKVMVDWLPALWGKL